MVTALELTRKLYKRTSEFVMYLTCHLLKFYLFFIKMRPCVDAFCIQNVALYRNALALQQKDNMRKRNEWFETWFDSKWYHLLYQNRDEAAAKSEIDSLISVVQLHSGARVLDLACGKGRHSIHMASHHLDVTGLDIAPASIEHAQQFENEHLHFYQHDMRLPFRSNYFDAVFNLFTSFGYFETMRENQLVLRNIASNLKPGGILLLDFLNHQQVRKQIVPHTTKEVGGITFDIRKEIIGEFIYKTIKFADSGKEFTHQEKVQLLTPDQFEELCSGAELKMEQRFGNYDKTDYLPDESPRFIFTARKNS